MSARGAKRTFSLKLSHQGFLLVVVLLAFEFVFVGGLWFLLEGAEREAQKQENLWEISVNTNRLIELNYIALDSLKDYAASQDSFHLLKYDKAAKEIIENLTWLDEHALSRHQKELVVTMKKKFVDIFEIVHNIRSIYDGTATYREFKALIKQKGRFEQLNNEMAPDFQELLKSQRTIESQSPQLEKQWRDRSKMFLLGGLALNVVAAMMMSTFFTRSIISRLTVLVDNTKRLKTGERLRSRLAGDDEIAQLDKVFHTIAEELRQSARKERQALTDSTEAESRIRQIINSMPVGLLISDRVGTIVFANPRAGELIGYSTGDLKGLQLVKLFPQYKPRLTEGVEQLYLELTDKPIETVVRKKGGQDLDIEFSITSFDRGSEKRFLITYLDVSERMEMQRMRQSFVAMVSHDLRTPLNSVQGVLELLEMGALGDISPEAREGVERASNNVIRLVGLINDLLDLEKMESGTLTIHSTTGAVDELFDKAVQAVADLAEKKGITISKRSNGTVAYCDFDRTLQVMVNLLGNAIRHSPDNGEIIIEASPQDGAVEISVIDEGPGVPEEYRQAIFERYQQVPGKDNGGTGLGLAICKAILAQHGSAIMVKDAFPEGKTGSKFSFVLVSDAAPAAELPK